MFFVALVFAVAASVFLIIKREYIYLVILSLMFLVSLPLSFRYNTMVNKPVETVLWIDISESMKGKVSNIDKLISTLNPNSVRFFGFPNNTTSDFMNLDTNKINIILSDFLFDIPINIISSNTIFVPVAKTVKTNHLINRVSFTNIGQIDYLNVDLLSKSIIKISSDGKTLFSPKKISSNYLIPISSLADEIVLHSVNTNINLKINSDSEMGIIWFDLNADFLRFNEVIRMYDLKCDYFLKITKVTNFSFEKGRFKELVVGYPGKDIKIDDLVGIVKKDGKIVIISPNEDFIRQIFKVTKLENVKVTTSSFLYSEKYKVFQLLNNYSGVVDSVFRYQYPVIDLKDVEVLEKDGYVVAFEYKKVDFLILMLKNVSRVDREIIKGGIIYSFSDDIYSNILKFLINGENKPTDKMTLSESAFDGGIVPSGRVVFFDEIKKLSDFKQSIPVIQVKEEDISRWWILMLLIVLIISIKWIVKG